MLSNYTLKAFISTTDTERAKQFYTEILGLPIISEDEIAMDFDADGTTLRITKVEMLTPQPYTVLGWDVMEIEDVIKSLMEKGVEFKRFAFFEQNELGIWTAPDGTKVAWFEDPDRNLLSLSE